MIGLFLKWMTIALTALAGFSLLTACYGLYELYIGACSDGCDSAQTFNAYFYVGAVGVTGFGVSALAAYKIGKAFRGED